MVRRMAAACFLGSLIAACTPAVHAQAKAVVAIFGEDARTAAYVPFDRVFQKSIVEPRAGKLQYYQEYLDNARFPGPEPERATAEYLRTRYAGKQVDLLLAVDPAALQFLLKYRATTFPGVPVVVVGLRTATLARFQLPDDFLAVGLDRDPILTIGMALRLRPNARELVGMTGTTDLDKRWAAAIQATPLPPNVRFRSLTGLPISTIERELASLGPDAIVVTGGSFRRDGAGQAFAGAPDILERLNAVTTAPIFTLYDTGIGKGAVASFSISQEAIAGLGADIANQLLDGTPVAKVVRPAPPAPVPVADWRELRRWGIDEALLPRGTDVRFREPGFWEQYRYHAIAVGALVLLETALVAGLMVQRRQRRKVEEELRQSEQTMQLAANAAQIVLWNWDIERDVIWRSESALEIGRALAQPEQSLAGLIGIIHPEDRESFHRAVDRALQGDGIFESEYRVPGAEGAERWFTSRGRVERVGGVPRRLRGVTLDVTRRKAAELDAQHRRNELAHLSRVTMLGELSGSVAHELNQPLMSILSNAQAARMFIGREPVDLGEIGEILDDIISDDKRAGEIIWSMRRMLKKEEVTHGLVQVNEVVQEVLRLMRGDLVNRGVSVDLALAADAPLIRGDRMQLQQVLLNLILNACDAMASNPKEERILAVATDSGERGVRVSVADRGEGIPPASLEGIFTPFFTTKKNGLGLGLSVCSSIIASHGGELRAANNAGRGATFTFVLKAEAAVFA